MAEFNSTGKKCKECTAKYWKTWRSNPVNVMKHIVNNVRTRAQKKGLPFSITYEDVPLPKKCPILGINIEPGDSQTDSSPTIDRFVPELGYIPGNVAVISNLANRIKTNATPDQIRMVADWLEQATTIKDPPFA